MSDERGRILLVDDDPVFTKVFGRELGRMGFLVQPGWGTDVLALLDREEIDIAILDIVMPGVDGLKLLEAIKSRRPDIDVVHVATPPLLVWGVARLGYHRRGWLLQTAISSVVLPACFWLTAPAANINWVFGPLGQQQSRLEPELYLVVAMAGYPLILYLPTHLMLRKLFPGMR